MDWNAVSGLTAVVALIIAGLSLASTMLGKSLSIREHEESRNNINNRIDAVLHQARRDDDRLEHRIEILEQTRPTTGELEARLRGARDA
jgi:hypothetical protein